MTPDLWGVLIPSIAALITALAAWINSQVARRKSTSTDARLTRHLQANAASKRFPHLPGHHPPPPDAAGPQALPPLSPGAGGAPDATPDKLCYRDITV